jgi:hypothetical protein
MERIRAWKNTLRSLPKKSGHIMGNSLARNQARSNVIEAENGKWKM